MLERHPIFHSRRILFVALATLFVLQFFSGSDNSSRFWRDADSLTWSHEDEHWRDALRTARRQDRTPASRSLGVADAIYVVSLRRREDRRHNMDVLARALDLQFHYVDATDFSASEQGKQLVENVMARVEWQRPRLDDQGVERWPAPDETSNKDFIKNAFPFQWSKDTAFDGALPLDVSGADYWDMSPLDKEWERAHPLPKREAGAVTRVRTASVRNNVRKEEWLSKGVVACWNSHVKTLREIVKKQHDVAIVFEDDIDIEWDAARLLRLQWPSLPPQWDIVYLGHCWSEEHRGAFLPGAPMLHETTHTLCTHAYAVSARGASRILRFLRSPDYAYSRPIDHALKDLVQMRLLKSYSVYPPVVVQTKSSSSDIVTGQNKGGWALKEALVDSTLERIALVANRTLG